MPDSNGETSSTDAASMPFTHFVNESEAVFAREHPEAKVTAFADTDIGKVILEQESKVASDYASGRISGEDYAAFRELGESRVESLKAHMQEVGEEWGGEIESWKHDAVASWQDFKAEHPDVMADLQTGNPSVVSAASLVDVVVQVVDPLVDPMVDGVHGILDAAREELGDTAQDFVEARAEQRGLDSDEIESSRVKVDLARETLDADVEKGHAAMDAFRDEAHHNIEAVSDGIHSYAESHPDSQLNDVSPGAITDPHIQEQIQQETQLGEA